MNRSLGMKNLIAAGIDRLKGADHLIRRTGFRNAPVIAVAAQKGGVGKTTTTVNLGCALAAGDTGKKVLIIDIDPQGHVSSSLRDAMRMGNTTLSQVLTSEKPMDLMQCVVNTTIDGLSITPPDKQLAETDSILASRVGREYILQAALVNARSHFDFILIDCPPNLGNLTLNALLAADQVLIPCDMSILAFEGVADLLSTVSTVNARLRHPLGVLGILRTRVDGRTRHINEAIGGALEANYGELLLNASIPINSALAKAQAAGQSIFQFQPSSRGAKAYTALRDELLDRMPKSLAAAAS